MKKRDRAKHGRRWTKRQLLALGRQVKREHGPVGNNQFIHLTGLGTGTISRTFGSWDAFARQIGMGGLEPDVVLGKREEARDREKLRRLATRAAVEDRLLRQLRAAYDRLPPLPAVKTVPAKGAAKPGSEDGLLILSDQHVGEVVSEAETGGLGRYDMSVFRYRLEFLAERVQRIAREHQPHLRVLNIGCLGDTISGMIHEELSETNEGNAVDMSLAAAHLHAQFLLDLLQTFERVDTWWITGNHGRTGKRYRFKERYLSWDYIIAQHVRALLRNEPRVRFTIPRSFWTVAVVRGQRLLFLHGDQIRSWQSIPFYGMQRAVGELMTLLRRRGGFDAIIMGHFHNVGILDRSDVELIVNGSMKGPDEFSIGALFQGSRPKQLFMGVHPKHGLSFRYPILLDTAPEGQPFRYRWDREYPEASLEALP